MLAVAVFAVVYARWQANEKSRASTAARDPYANRDGKSEAERELAGGKLVVVRCGLPEDWFREYCQILRTRYEIEVRVIAGCMLTTPLRNYASSYNEVMDKRIKSVFGDDVFKKAEAEAKVLFEQRGTEKPANQALEHNGDDRHASCYAPVAPIAAVAHL
jgi:hypothetical protein